MLLRPSDFDDGRAGKPVQIPSLGFYGFGRFVWRQLTSMRTALVLLLLLAIAAIPGSLFPQRSSDPNGVLQIEREDPELFRTLETLQVFNTFESVWFSAIYLLLFISLIGCIVPRASHHLGAIKSPPPPTPKNLERFEENRTVQVSGSQLSLLSNAGLLLRKRGYRVRFEKNSISAEKGYLRETANLIFHLALVGVLLGLAVGSGFKYQGQKILIEGQTFTNQLTSYDSFNPGRFFSESSLEPYSLRLNSFEATYEFDLSSGLANPLDFLADVTVADSSGTENWDLKVNSPVDHAGTSVFLLGNGFAPWITVYSDHGEAVFSQPVPFLPQDANLTSIGVVKIPDGLRAQVGLIGFIYPSAVELSSGALASVYPEPDRPVLTLNVFRGNLGLDEGVPKNVYSLDTESLVQLTGGDTNVDSLVLSPGERVNLPAGLGSIEFTELRRFVSVDIHRDPTQLPVGISAGFIMISLVATLFVSRRRVWVKISKVGPGRFVVQFAALARGEDSQLGKSLDELVEAFSKLAGSKIKV